MQCNCLKYNYLIFRTPLNSTNFFILFLNVFCYCQLFFKNAMYLQSLKAQTLPRQGHFQLLY
jgi:hypothetical protein